MNNNQKKLKSKGKRAVKTPGSGSKRVGRYTPPTNPPDTTSQPWWPLILSVISSPGDFTFTSLIKAFQKQVNSSGSTFNVTDFNDDKGVPFRIQIRFQRVAVWNLTGRIVSLSVWDVEQQTTNSFDQREKDQLGAWVDCGGASCFPSIGYTYPPSYQQQVYRPDPRYASLAITSTTGGSRDSILHHVHILWKSDGYPKFDSVSRPIRDLETRLENLSGEISTLTETANEIKSSQPSTLIKVVEGLTLVASYVAPLVAEPSAETYGGTAANIAAVVARDDRISFDSLSISSEEDKLEDAS